MKTTDRTEKTATVGEPTTMDPRALRLLRGVRALVCCYLGLSVLTLLFAALMADNPAVVTEAVWIRGGIVVLSALVMLLATVRAAAGNRRSFLRVRVLSGAMVVAIVVIISLPGLFPLWMKIEQGACALLLLGVAALVNGGHLRAQFAR